MSVLLAEMRYSLVGGGGGWGRGSAELLRIVSCPLYQKYYERLFWVHILQNTASVYFFFIWQESSLLKVENKNRRMEH